MDPDSLGDYRQSIAQRAAQDLPPLGLEAQDVLTLIERLQNSASDEAYCLKDLLLHQVPAGHTEAARHKAQFLSDIATGRVTTPLFTPADAIQALGRMWSSYGITALISLLDHPAHAHLVCDGLASTVFLFDAYYDVLDRYHAGCVWAKTLLTRWSQADWFYQQPALPQRIRASVFKLSSTVTAAMLSPVQAAWSRADIALHAQSLLQTFMPDAIAQINVLKQNGYPLLFVADELDTRAARPALRQAGLNALLWHFGESMPDIPNQVHRGFILASKIDAKTYEAAADKGVLVMEGDTANLQMGQIVDIDLMQNQVKDNNNQLVTGIILQPDALNSWRAGGRLSWRLGRLLTTKACDDLKLPMLQFEQLNASTSNNAASSAYSLAQKIMGRACGMDGILPGMYCEPRITVIDGQFINALSTCDALKWLPFSGASVDCVVHPFQHNKLDATQTHIQLKPGDGIIKYWLNHLLLPGELMLSQDAYTRSALGLSFTCTADQLSCSTITGLRPMTMPESVRIRFHGQRQPGITIQDLVYAIPYEAIKKGWLDPKGERNCFAGRILEIEGLSALTTEQANLFVEAVVDRGAVACVAQLSTHAVQNHIKTSIGLLNWMIHKGYDAQNVLKRRMHAMEEWQTHATMVMADEKAQYVATLDIQLDAIKEPFVVDFQHPNQVWCLSEAPEMEAIHDVFIGPSGMQLSDYHAVGHIITQNNQHLSTRLWVTPSNKLDGKKLMAEGAYAHYAQAGARTDMPDHTLCLGNRLQDNQCVVATSRHHFSSQRAKGITGFLVSPFMAAHIALLGRLPQYKEYKSLCDGLPADRAYLPI